jgi:threonine dehydratase
MSPGTAGEARISPERIERAAAAASPAFAHTPQVSLSRSAVPAGTAAEIVCKVETVNPIRCFKGRGAEELVRRLGPGRHELVCASAGNFGQGVAYAAGAAGVPVTVFAAEAANPAKVERMRALGAEVTLGGRDFDEAKELARRHAEAHGGRFVEDGREAAISEGAGAIAVELLERDPGLDAIVVPVGNGALIVGIAHWVAAAAPAIRVIGVCAAGAPAMERSFHTGGAVSCPAATIADGIAVRVPVPEALADMLGVVDDVVLVDDEQIVAAMRLVHGELGLVAEPAGAAGVAAVLAGAGGLAGARVATVLTGSNVAPADMRRWLTGL